MSGVELSDYLTKKQPELKTLFMSGYPQDNLSQRNLAQFLPKPFSSAKLTQKVRDVLDMNDRE